MTRTVFDESVDVPDGLVDLFARSGVSLTVADYTRDDCPLIGANQHFFDLCGYNANEVIGHNCRFLQPAGGAGPVRERMRRFLQDPQISDGKFLVPNVTKDGRPFLNLIYMSKLTRRGKPELVLGSQFHVAEKMHGTAELYDRSLREDLRELDLLTSESNWLVLGSFEALASSHSIIAQARVE